MTVRGEMLYPVLPQAESMLDSTSVANGRDKKSGAFY